MPNYQTLKERTVKIVSGGSYNLCTRVGVLANDMAGLYQTVDRIGDCSAGSQCKFDKGFPGCQASTGGYGTENILLMGRE
jgi:hypothetical protein